MYVCVCVLDSHGCSKYTQVSHRKIIKLFQACPNYASKPSPVLFQPGAAKGRERVAWGISPGETQGFWQGGTEAPVGFMEIGETK